MSEGRQDPRGERRRASAVDEPEQVVQVDLGIGRELSRQRSVEAGLAQDVSASGLDLGLDAAPGRTVQVGLHVWLARRGATVLRG